MSSNRSFDSPPRGGTWARRVLIVSLVLLILAHLVLSAIEIAYRPIFPWDGWVNWMYRAKAWYLSGGVGPLDPVTLWETGEPRHTYAIVGHQYPALLPLIAYAMALLTGAWSETLVNLPTALAGLGLAAGTYLIARDFGYSRLIALIAAYLVISTPLVGAHLALAGQADIWMTLTCGLGFACLLVGLTAERLRSGVLGLGLIALSTQFKSEGAVWFLTALVLTAVALRPRTVLLAIALLACAAIVLWHLGITHLDIPLLGTLGIVEDRLYVPLLGDYAIRRYDLADDYLDNFYLRGSWNLLWFLLSIASAVALWRCRRDRGAAIGLAFLVLAAGAQAFIFLLTEQGAWAEDWTAINRLPLHFVPALVVASLLILVPGPAPSPGGEGFASRTALILVAALVTAAAGAQVLVDTRGPQALVQFPGSALRTPIGAGVADGDTLRVRRFDGNVALVTSGPIRVAAGDVALVRIATGGSARKAPVFFWRTAQGGELHQAPLAGLGDLYIDVRDEGAWTGQITEVGLLFYDDGGSVSIEGIALHAASPLARLERALRDWRWVAPWSQKSVNWLPAGNPRAHLPLPLLLAAVLLTGIIASILIWRRDPRTLGAAVIGVFIAVWIVGDLRWLLQRATLAGSTIRSYSLLSSAPLQFGNDGIVAAAVQRALCDRERPGSTAPGALPRLVIGSDSEVDMRFEVLRAKYHALPTPAHAHEGSPSSIPAHLADRVLILKLRYGRANTATYDGATLARQLAQRSGKPFRVAWENAEAALLTAAPEADDAACWSAGP